MSNFAARFKDAAFRGLIAALALALSATASPAQSPPPSASLCPDGTPRYFSYCPESLEYTYPLDFDAVNAGDHPPFSVAADPLLHTAGISVVQRSPADSVIVFINNKGEYTGQALRRTVSDNFLTQVNTNNAPASFTLQFSAPVKAVSFMVPAVWAASQSGVTFPAWRATALGSRGDVLSSHEEGLKRRFADDPAQTFELTAPAFEPITAVRFESDPRLNGVPFAGFSTIHIERLGIIPWTGR
jgi:hypothetical protein